MIMSLSCLKPNFLIKKFGFLVPDLWFTPLIAPQSSLLLELCPSLLPWTLCKPRCPLLWTHLFFPFLTSAQITSNCLQIFSSMLFPQSNHLALAGCLSYGLPDTRNFVFIGLVTLCDHVPVYFMPNPKPHKRDGKFLEGRVCILLTGPIQSQMNE